MAKKQYNPYAILDHYVLRAPLLPFDLYKNALSKDYLSVTDFHQILKNRILREGIYLASPELYGQMLKWEQGTLTDPKKIQRLQQAILKYFTRITTRCTPFGLFASCSSGTFKEKTAITLNDTTAYHRYTRLDTTFLSQLSQVLIEDKEIRSQLLFYPNTSLYSINDHYRYVEYRIENKKRVYALEGIMKSDAIQVVLEQAATGKTIKSLATLLVEEDITLEEGTSFIEELVQNQVLVSELEITVTGEYYFHSLLDKVNKIPEVAPRYQQLKTLQKALTVLDSRLGNDMSMYSKSLQLALEIVPQLDAKYVFQTDCFSTSQHNHLSRDIKKQLHKGFLLFHKMTAASANGNLEQFKNNFIKRFEESEIPLHFALDTETGIGYGVKKEDSNNLIDDLSIGNPTKKRYERIIWTDVDDILHKKLVAATQNKDYSLQLIDKDFEELPLDVTDLPDTLSSMIEIYDTQVFMNSAGGSSAVNLLGRFSYGETALLDHVNKIAHLEEQLHPDKILAEIVHLPEARTGNILQRPHIRKYEIPYLGHSKKGEAHQIPIEDLLVSLKNGSIVLRSKKLHKEVLPRLGNAHNYSGSSLPIYQFLCELQSQKKRAWIGFEWNTIHKKQIFLPRVVYGDLIFSKARWNIETETFKSLFKSHEILVEIGIWQGSLQLPDQVELIEGDNKLLIHLTNKTSVTLLLETIKNTRRFQLEEFLFEENGIVKDPEGNTHCNQMVVSFYNKEKLEQVSAFAKAEQAATVKSKMSDKKVQNTFSIGTEWIYYKIYCGVKTADEVLLQVLRPICARLLKDQCIDKWFFIRYSDPDAHIRMRFHSTDEKSIQQILLWMRDSLDLYIENGQVWDLQLATYQRELERYGTKTMEEAESLFYYDSEQVLYIIEHSIDDRSRFLHTFHRVEQWMEHFQLSAKEQLAFLSRMQSQFKEEFQVKKQVNKQLNLKYKNLEPQLFTTHTLKTLHQTKIEATIAQFIGLKNTQKLEVSMDSLLASFIHMTINRVFRSQQRLHEMMIYDFLHKKVTTKMARYGSL